MLTSDECEIILRCMRTTIDIDAPILEDLKRLQKKERKSLGRLVSDLLADALNSKALDASAKQFEWPVSEGKLLVDLLDKDALWKILNDRS